MIEETKPYKLIYFKTIRKTNCEQFIDIIYWIIFGNSRFVSRDGVDDNMSFIIYGIGSPNILQHVNAIYMHDGCFVHSMRTFRCTTILMFYYRCGTNHITFKIDSAVVKISFGVL